MKKTNGITAGTKIFGKLGFQLKKHSPEILIAAGVIGTVASVILACRATTKLSGILDKAKDDIDAIHTCAEDEDMAEKYSQEDAKKDLAITYAHTGLELAKLYAPAAIIGALSLASIITSHNILRQRNLGLAAANAAAMKVFKEYRSRVAERFGEDIEREIRYNIKAKTFTETLTDGESGEEKVVENTVPVASADTSDYSRFFDETCKAWEKDSEYNLMFLRAQQQYANDLLRSRGYLFLNEIYTMLGILPTKAGQVVGWIYDAKHPTGDNFVDFNIYDCNREANRDFVNGYERSILLDFNVDGYILDRLEGAAHD